VKTKKRYAKLPIGRTAKIAFELDAMRATCSQAAQMLMTQQPLDDAELEECARLGDGLAKANRILRATVRNIMLTRLHRRSRARRD